jgi:hypothetical protein
MTLLSPVLAQIGNPAVTMGQGQDGVTFVGNFIAKGVLFVVSVGGISFFFMLLVGAVRWITSGGDKASVESARAQITQALTGIVILFSVWAIARLVDSVFGYDLLNIDFAPLINN